MPKCPTFPELYDEVKTISLTDLKRQGYLEPNRVANGGISWSRGERNTGSIGILVSTIGTDWYVQLSYIYEKEKRIDYKVNLVSVPSNLGIGKVWYFLCPKTGKKCRKLYLMDTLFLHREAYQGNAMYSVQTESKEYRRIRRVFDRIEAMSCAKHTKRYYRNKITKRYAKALAAQAMERNDMETLRTIREWM